MATLRERIELQRQARESLATDLTEQKSRLRLKWAAKIRALILEDVRSPGPEVEQAWRHLLISGRKREDQWTKREKLWMRLEQELQKSEDELLEKEQARALMWARDWREDWTEMEASGPGDVDDRDAQQHENDADWVDVDGMDGSWAQIDVDPVERVLQASSYEEPSLPLCRAHTWSSLQILFKFGQSALFGTVESIDGEDVLQCREDSVKLATWAPWPVLMREQLVIASRDTRLMIKREPQLRDAYVYVMRESVESLSSGSYKMQTTGRFESLDDANLSALRRIDKHYSFIVRLAYIRQYFRNSTLEFDDFHQMDDTCQFHGLLVNDVVREAEKLGEARVAWHLSEDDGTLIVSGFNWARDEFVVVEVKKQLVR